MAKLECIAEKKLLGIGENNWQPCYKSSLSHRPFPKLGIAKVGAFDGLDVSPLSAAVRRAYEDGSLVLPLNGAGLSKELQVVRLAGAHGGGLKLDALGTLEVGPALRGSAGASDFTALPVAFISPAAAKRLGLIPAGPIQYLLAPAAHQRLEPTLLRRWLPADLQASARLITDNGPSLPGVANRLVNVFTVIAALLAAAIATSMIVLWVNDLRPELQMLGAVGATPSWRRRLVSTMTGLLASGGAVVGVLSGSLASMGFLHNVRTPLALPNGHLWLLLLLSIALPVAVGGALAPRSSRSMRRGG